MAEKPTQRLVPDLVLHCPSPLKLLGQGLLPTTMSVNVRELLVFIAYSSGLAHPILEPLYVIV
jgi:hypothetical protein